MKSRTYANDHERLFSRVEKTESCWFWKGGTDGGGYGRIVVKCDGRNDFFRVHRFAFELLVGPIPDGLVVHHICGEKLCVNPEHLDLLTPVEHGFRLSGRSQHGTEGRYARGCRCRTCRDGAAAARRRRRAAAVA